MRCLLAAASGWGKSWYAQAVLETNLTSGQFDGVIICDYKDEFRGLVKADLAKHYIVGPREADWGVAKWRAALEQAPNLVLARLETLDQDSYRDILATVIKAARILDETRLVAIDEAHFVAEQGAKTPEEITGLATTGRGEGASSMWITQRLQTLDETVLSQCNTRILGGFTNKNDRNKFRADIEYPVDVHKPGGQRVQLPPELEAPEGPLSVRMFEEGDSTIGSEWIRSDESGTLARIDTRDVEMQSTHYGAQGQNIAFPGGGP